MSENHFELKQRSFESPLLYLMLYFIKYLITSDYSMFIADNVLEVTEFVQLWDI
ncbi:hypothetical protein FD47_GL000122 [Lentilactobacillus parafarraginis DSM 18390 = JCM 14109]|uniref:Uncharacterized protein n=1 Tax=Lentilactobacillus parafarraginis DSM 18390 = JCM 14109 TaxID=1423786 RepID=A0A0R1YQZ6_9LACO|nr:hypothetical protein FD47_GL000122 [Lentilactobacillus parafarraginis DSM 18390 = JCM 14109]